FTTCKLRFFADFFLALAASPTFFNSLLAGCTRCVATTASASHSEKAKDVTCRPCWQVTSADHRFGRVLELASSVSLSLYSPSSLKPSNFPLPFKPASQGAVTETSLA